MGEEEEEGHTVSVYRTYADEGSRTWLWRYVLPDADEAMRVPRRLRGWLLRFPRKEAPGTEL